MMNETGHDVNAIETVVTDRLPLPIYQDPHELKKRRNRLAQRKHRQRLTSTESPATRKRPSIPERVTVQQLPTPENDEASTRYLWDTSRTRDSFAGFENGGVDASMDYSIPTSSENATDSRHTSPELEHFVSRMWQPNFEHLDTGCLSDAVLNSQGAYMHCSNMAYGTSGIPDQHELQLPRIRADPALASPIPGMVTMPQCLPVSYPERMPNASIDILGSPRSASGHRAVPGNKSPHLSPHDSPKERFAHHGQPVSSNSGRNPVGLETRFEHVIKAVEECGFKSIDDMSAQYYTATFKEDTAPFWAQSRSRSRSLPGLLASLHDSTKTWTTRDMQNYKQQVTNMAEDIYVGELSTAKQNVRKENDMWHGQEAMSTAEQSDKIVENLWAAISDIEFSPGLKQKKMMIRENMPELWSLLVELTRKADLRQPRGSQAVGAFLLLLGSCVL